MNYLLDTNICIYLIKRKPPEVIQRFQSLTPTDIKISAITVAELEYGAFKSQNVEKNRDALNQFLLPLEILAFEPAETQIYGQIRADLSRRGVIIGAMDMLIAAQAISQNLTLVTNNMREFSRIPSLRLENWVRS
ncbi:MAG: type II toxin-antitoxin system VapC family toxin [Coleofasciculaceae cyanobacterium SM2_3_26]|nr:type II toxin-antitoxin system VapC family toxin [Coleofasciculaceae cyanobacterium SM2_3_26]